MYNALCSKLDDLYFSARVGLNKIFREETGEVNVIATVLLIGVAIAVVLIFKEQITTLVTTLMGTLTNKATNAMN